MIKLDVNAAECCILGIQSADDSLKAACDAVTSIVTYSFDENTSICSSSMVIDIDGVLETPIVSDVNLLMCCLNMDLASNTALKDACAQDYVFWQWYEFTVTCIKSTILFESGTFSQISGVKVDP